MKKILRQSLICLLIAISVFTAKSVDNTNVNRGIEVLSREIHREYSKEDLAAFKEKSVSAVKRIQSIIGNASVAVNSSMKYGEPIDSINTTASAILHSVGGGTVISTGTSESIGNYIIISHGEEAESIYGNLKTIKVTPMERVKKGQIIGEYDPAIEKDFYYTFNYLD